MGIRYGSDESLELCDLIGKTMLNEAVKQSALIAKEYGTFSEYKYENISKSKFFIENLNEDTKEMVKKYGLRNSQLLTIPPTGSISTMIGISGGIEPIFNLSYIRKTESLHDEDVYYKVYT
ncbi:ribonucleoside-diphosphate reductase, adenosylcobalamin-dependent, partial [Clostridioides difficile]|nr:ribonucleoside-diphosphate reductase, adenosylcobalamin-dependent [Clostridioides difficile]